MLIIVTETSLIAIKMSHRFLKLSCVFILSGIKDGVLFLQNAEGKNEKGFQTRREVTFA